MKAKSKASVGSRLVSRLKRFTEQLATVDNLEQRFTCRKVTLKIEPRQYDPALVKKTREILQLSQPLFAQFIGVSTAAVRDWEQGQKPPRGAACRLMDEIQHNPEYFRERLRALSSPAT